MEDMAYTTNPFLPRVRTSAVILVKNKGWTVRKTARYLGVSPGTISKWLNKSPDDLRKGIPTLSSRPKTSPNRISKDIENAIVAERLRTKRCGQVIHYQLQKRGVRVSLSTVHRTLKRRGLIKKRSPWKRRHTYIQRPIAVNLGDLVEADTIHKMIDKSSRMYVYTLIDLTSRWAFAWASDKISAGQSLKFIKLARNKSSFEFNCIQTDHGPEFSQHFSERLGITHRHSRVRKPNDNGHVERFNRTLKEECLNRSYASVQNYNKLLKEYLPFYNEERPHMGINYLTPLEMINKVFPRS